MKTLNFNSLKLGTEVLNKDDKPLKVVEYYGETFVFDDGSKVNDERLTKGWREVS